MGVVAALSLLCPHRCVSNWSSSGLQFGLFVMVVPMQCERFETGYMQREQVVMVYIHTTWAIRVLVHATWAQDIGVW
jgi:hypothetical protein